MTIRCGGMLRSITMAAHAIAAAVTVIVIAGQLFRRMSLAAMQPYHSFCQPLPPDRGYIHAKMRIFRAPDNASLAGAPAQLHLNQAARRQQSFGWAFRTAGGRTH